jgi:phosphonate transport system permease protein
MAINVPRMRFLAWLAVYAALVGLCFASLQADGDLSFGRQPWANLQKTVGEFAHPSFLDAWLGNTHLEYRSEDGTLLRTEDERVVERAYLAGLAEATWTTIKIGTLGSLIAAIAALPLGMLGARNLGAPRLLRVAAKVVLDLCRAIHTLVFGLVFVGIFGLGPTAGILAIAAHSLGTYGKLYGEAVETLDMASVEAVRAVGAGPAQVFFTAIWPAVLPQFVSSHLYLWEFNIRDATILGMIGAGGLGLLLSEAVSLFQWNRLATVLLVVIALVWSFDALSRRVRRELL